MRLTIGRKVLLGNVVMVATIAGVAAWLAADLRDVNRAVSLASDAQEQVIAINAVAADVDHSRRMWGRVIVSLLDVARAGWADSPLASTRAELRGIQSARDSVISRVRQSDFGARPTIRRALDDLCAAADEMGQVFDEAERLTRMGLPDAAEEMLHRWHEPDDRLQSALRTLRDQARADARSLIDESDAFRRRFQWRSTVMLSAVVAIVLATVVLLGRGVRASTRRLGRALEVIAEGDFNQRADIAGRDEFRELADGVNAMSARLGELDELKAGFLSNVSHELRTPIASLKQTAALLDEQAVGPLNDDQRELMQVITSNSQRLGALINDLLDTARLEAGKVELRIEAVDLADLVREVVRTVAPLALEKELRVVMRPAAETPPVSADPLRIEQVLVNLLSNAIKFTPDGGEVTITCAPDGHGMVECAVSDTGVGIPAEDLPAVFDKFHQVDAARTAKVKGTGLGLTIVKHLVENHGGSIRVESSVGVGTVFTFALPAADAAGN